MPPVRLLAGTSGYSYKEWKGSFYPESLPDRGMLAFYAERLPTVEINNTFYRLPQADVVRRWAAEVPEGFVFVVKAPQRITHHARLKDAEERVDFLWRAVSELGPHRGPLLFQLPPSLRKDVERLRTFLGHLPAECRAAFEFRHRSWDDEEVRAVLRAAGAALCNADVAEEGDDAPPAGAAAAEPELHATADWGYLRLRRPDYGEAELARWAERVAGAPWREAFVFFKHEDAGTAPRLAQRFRELCAARAPQG